MAQHINSSMTLLALGILVLSPQAATAQQTDAPQQAVAPQQTATPQPAAAQQPATTPQQAGDNFAEGDVLKISAYGRDDLTGQYTVQPGPVVSLPLIGTVNLANHTARQLETELATSWENRLGSPMSVTVEFAQRAPFYVLGDVNNPGTYPYRTGLTVLQAVAVSGGVLRARDGGQSPRLDALRERERREQAIEALAAAQVRKARLLAERDGKEEVVLAQPFTLVSKERIGELIAEETLLLQTRAKRYALKENLLSEQVRLGESEIAAYQRQYDEMGKQQDQIAKESSRAKRLPGQQVRVFELDQRVTTLETTMSSIKASMTRTMSEVAAARSAISDMQEERQNEISQALLDAEKDIRQGEITEAATRETTGSTESGDQPPALTFQLMHQGSGEVTNVQSTSPLKPGDLLEVTLSGAPGAALAAQEK